MLVINGKTLNRTLLGADKQTTLDNRSNIFSDMDKTNINIRLVGSTLDLYRGSISASSKREYEKIGDHAGELSTISGISQTREESNYFKSAQW